MVFSNSEFHNVTFFMNVSNDLESKFLLEDCLIRGSTSSFFLLSRFTRPEDFEIKGTEIINEEGCMCIAIVSSDDWIIGEECIDCTRNYFESNGTCNNNQATVRLTGSNSKVEILNTTIVHPNGTGIHCELPQLEINRCSILECDFGILSSTNDNLEINRTFFSNNNVGLAFNSSEGNVTNSIFSDNDIGIKISYPNQNIGIITVIDSEFENDIDIHTTGANDNLFIAKNEFMGSQYGIYADGESKFEIMKNNFWNSLINSVLLDNGQKNNLMQENNLYGRVGIHTNGINDQFKFFDNCFSTFYEDANLNGTVEQLMGSVQITKTIGAGNCFTHLNGVSDINHSGNSFKYFLPQQVVGSCHEPLTQSQYTIENADEIFNKSCGSGEPISTIKDCPYNRRSSCLELLSQYNSLLEDSENIKMNEPLHGSPEEVISIILLRELRNCLRYTEKWLFIKGCHPDQEIILEKGATSSDDEDFYRKSETVGVLISLKKYNQAMVLLNNLGRQELTEEAKDFIDVQKLNLRYLQEENFNADVEELDFLRRAGNKRFPLAAYSRALLTILTGEIIYPEIELLNNINLRSKDKEESYSNNLEIRVFPNPVESYLNIELKNIENLFNIEIISIDGQIILYQSMEYREMISINTETWYKGMYILRISDSSGEQLHLEKILKL